MSDGIVPPLFCRHAAADRASDGNDRRTYFQRRPTPLTQFVDCSKMAPRPAAGRAPPQGRGNNA